VAFKDETNYKSTGKEGAFMNRIESLAEKRLREAIENGEFDNLQGKGEPIDLSENPFEDPDLRAVHRLLRNAIQFSSVLPLCLRVSVVNSLSQTSTTETQSSQRAAQRLRANHCGDHGRRIRVCVTLLT